MQWNDKPIRQQRDIINTNEKNKIRNSSQIMLKCLTPYTFFMHTSLRLFLKNWFVIMIGGDTISKFAWSNTMLNLFISKLPITLLCKYIFYAIQKKCNK